MKYQLAEHIIIDTARYRISAGGGAIPVEPKVFDLLVYLIRHRDRVLSREELLQEVWDGRDVSDATLSNHVKSARKLLGDSGDLQQTILTIRGRGYQFIAPVGEIPDGVGGPGEDRAPALLPAAGRVSNRVAHPWRLALAIVVLLLLAVVLGWRIFAPSPARPGSELPYVVVVPFDVSGDAPDAWRPFADQVTREVIRNLRKISGLRVVPTPSAFTFKDNKAREHIRRQLPDVQYVLDGVVSISGDNAVRITAELEDLNKGLLVWDEDYEGRTDDTNLFAMQSGIAAAVSNSLKVAILADERRALGELPTTNLKAYELYVAGRQQMELYSHESQLRAIELFDQAIAKDPKFVAAYVARGDAYRILFAYFEPPINMLPAVVSSLSDALELSPGSAEVLSSLGLTYVMAWRWKDAWAMLSEAQARDPTLALTELGFALYYSGLGEVEKVKSSLAAADRLDPLNSELADWGQWALFMVGENAAARAWGEEKMRQHPNTGVIFSSAGVGAYLAGDHARAVALAERGAELDRSPVALLMLAQAYGYAGQKEKVQPLLDEAASNGTYVCPYESAAAHLSIGDRERALSLLNEAVEKRSNCLIFLRNDPRMKVLREDPRYQVLLTRVGLDDTALASYERQRPTTSPQWRTLSSSSDGVRERRSQVAVPDR
jgi:DNA-binding winged helix-turn-helix (wHTH) protein/TolB-like protein/Tfp pilus assembly protein PilF